MNLLKFKRIEARLTQAQLAMLAHVPQSDIAQIELGRLTPSPKNRRRLADALDVPYAELLSEVQVATK